MAKYRSNEKRFPRTVISQEEQEPMRKSRVLPTFRSILPKFFRIAAEIFKSTGPEKWRHTDLSQSALSAWVKTGAEQVAALFLWLLCRFNRRLFAIHVRSNCREYF